MKSKTRERLNLALGFILLGLMVWGFIWLLSTAWRLLSSVDTNLAVGLVTAASTIVVATVTVTIGKYFERKRSVDAHFRDAKVQIYDEFLKEFFRIFHGDGEESDTSELTKFLKEWQRKMVLYGGGQVLATYLKWKSHLSKGSPDANTFFLMGDFFLAMRKDMGLSNKGISRKTFAHLILRHPQLFLEMAKENPNVTLAELAAKEKELGLEKD